MKIVQPYTFDEGVINAIPMTRIPLNALHKSQNMIHFDGRLRKLRGLADINATAIGTDPVWSVFRYHKIIPKTSQIIAASGAGLYKFDEQTDTFIQVYNQLVSNQQVDFLVHNGGLYFGSTKDLWRRFDGDTVTYSVGGNNGQAADAPRKFSQILLADYAGRFLGIGEEANPDLMYFSEHIDEEGIEKWPDGNTQIIQSVKGDTPKFMDIYEGRSTFFNQNSISSGNIVGVPSNWSFDREKSQTGTVAKRTVKRFGNFFLMLTSDFELYKWPNDIFVSKGRVKFYPNPYKAHLACAEIVDNRFYYLCFESGEGGGADKYHLWIYDILADKFYGPHKGFNVVSMIWDVDTNLLLCGGIDDLAGFVLNHQGKSIKNKAQKIHVVSSFNDFDAPQIDKRYTKVWTKSKQEGSSEFQLIVNTDNRFDRPQSRQVAMEDPANDNTMETAAVKEAVTKFGHIHEQFGRGNAINFEIRHEDVNADFQFDNLQLEYYTKYTKKNRGEG